MAVKLQIFSTYTGLPGGPKGLQENIRQSVDRAVLHVLLEDAVSGKAHLG